MFFVRVGFGKMVDVGMFKGKVYLLVMREFRKARVVVRYLTILSANNCRQSDALAFLLSRIVRGKDDL